MLEINLSSHIPQVSVVMAIYKEPIEWIRLSIDSILNQTFTDFEFIIINDNPIRIENRETLNEYVQRDKRIIVITNEHNIGLTKSLNKGLSIARGQYIARMDADDISLPERFEMQFAFLEKHPEAHVCGCNIKPFGKVSVLTSKVKKFPQSHNAIVATLFFENPIAHPVVMFRKYVNDWQLRYNEEIKKAQDYYLWFDLYMHNAKFDNLQLGLLNYRISEIQISHVASTDQLYTADKIHEQLLNSINIKDTDDIDIHNEICRLKQGKFSLKEKLQYLIKLYNITRKTQESAEFRDVIAKYSMLTCLVHKNPRAIFRVPFVRSADVFSIWFIRECIKFLMGKV